MFRRGFYSGYSYRLGKMQTYPARFDMRMFATEKAKELNRAEKEKKMTEVKYPFYIGDNLPTHTHPEEKRKENENSWISKIARTANTSIK